MTKPMIGKPEVNRRTFLYAAGATAIGVGGWEADHPVLHLRHDGQHRQEDLHLR